MDLNIDVCHVVEVYDGGKWKISTDTSNLYENNHGQPSSTFNVTKHYSW